MNIKITYYLDLTSSWCYWAEPAWAELKKRYAKSPVEFDWQIALLDASGMSKSREQADWYYRRSGTIAIAVHDEFGLAGSHSAGVSRDQLRGRSCQGFWREG
jgi:predicted DsbA family dithiol-disulfide isomerase